MSKPPRTLLTTATFAAATFAGLAAGAAPAFADGPVIIAAPGPIVEVLPPDEDASPKPGEQHPIAALVNATTIYPALSVPGTALIKSAGKSAGNSKWGMRWYAMSAASGEHHSPTNGVVRADVGAEFEVTLFGHTKSVFETQLTAISRTWGTNSASVDAYVLGAQVLDSSESNATNADASWSKSISKTFFSYSHTWTLGPIPVVVKVGVGGGVGVSAHAEAPENRATVSFGPSAHLDGVLSVGVGVDLGLIEASAGIEGHVRFIEAGLTFENEVKRSVVALGSTKYSYDMSADLELEALAGHLDLYALWDGIWLNKKWTKKILDWDGITVDKTLWSAQGQQTFNDGVIIGIGG
jgi:hypothetical protein